MLDNHSSSKLYNKRDFKACDARKKLNLPGVNELF